MNWFMWAHLSKTEVLSIFVTKDRKTCSFSWRESHSQENAAFALWKWYQNNKWHVISLYKHLQWKKIIVIVWINAVCKHNIVSRDTIFRSQGTTGRWWHKGRLTLKRMCVLDTEITKMFIPETWNPSFLEENKPNNHKWPGSGAIQCQQSHLHYAKNE